MRARKTFSVLYLFLLEEIITVRLYTSAYFESPKVYDVILMFQVYFEIFHCIDDLSHGRDDVGEDHSPPCSTFSVRKSIWRSRVADV